MSERPRDEDLNFLLLLLLATYDQSDEWHILLRRVRDMLRASNSGSPQFRRAFETLSSSSRDAAELPEFIVDELMRRLRETRMLSHEVRELVFRIARRSWSKSSDTYEAQRNAAAVTAGIFDHYLTKQSEMNVGLHQHVEKLEAALRQTEEALQTKIDTVAVRTEMLRDTAAAHDDAIRNGADTLYSHLWLVSVGASAVDAKLVRHVPVRVYVADPLPNEETLTRLATSLELALAEVGLEKSLDLPAQSGSWLKRFFARTTDVASQEEVRSRLEKFERAAQVAVLDKPQAEANKHQAEATSAIINALKDIPSACIQVGSLLVVKWVGPDNKPAIVARTLTPRELKKLEEDQGILANPQTILQVLASSSSPQLATNQPDSHHDVESVYKIGKQGRPTLGLPPAAMGGGQFDEQPPPSGTRQPE